MSDEGDVEQRSISGALLGVVAVALLAALGGLVWSYGLQNHLSAAEQKIAAADQKNAELTQQLKATNARLRATSETLGQSVGMSELLDDELAELAQRFPTEFAQAQN